MLEKLEFLVALAREKHFRRAAESCGVAQPTLSLGIQGLEQMLGAPLVRRSSRFQGFTPEGERVLVWARRLVGDAEAMRQEIMRLQRGVGAHIRIAALPSAMSIVTLLTVPFQERHPEARFTVLARPSDTLMALLHQRDIDAGITYIDNDPIDDVIRIPLYREEYLLLTRAHGAEPAAKRMRWADVGKLPLCLLTSDLQHRRIIESVLRSVGVTPAPTLETDSAAALLSHVQTGRWSSIVPRSMIQSMGLSTAVRAIPLVMPEVSRTIGLVVSERFSIQPSVLQLIREARLLTPTEMVAAE